MKIWTCSKKHAKAHLDDIVKDDSLRVISVNDFDETSLDFGTNKNPQKALVLFFADNAPNDKLELDENEKLFDKTMARQILAFAINALNDSKKLLVHCTAGVSRSTAISIALNTFLNKIATDNLDDWDYNTEYGFENSPVPNPHISSVMNQVIRDFLQTLE